MEHDQEVSIMEKKTYALYSKDEFMRIYEDVTSDKKLLAVLVEMQTRLGIHEQKAWENASQLVGEVVQFEAAKDRMLEEPEDVIDGFLRTSQSLKGYDRKVVLHQLDFGLGLYTDQALLDQLKEGVSPDALFRRYYAAHGEDPELTEAVLEERIRQRMAGFHLSPKVLKNMIRKLEKTDNVMLTAAALGEDNLRIKCIAAMDLHLRSDQEIALSDAAMIACSHAEVEAVADAVSRGQMASETAFRILIAVCLTALVLSLFSMIGASLVPGMVETVIGDSAWSALNGAYGFASLSSGQTLMEAGVRAGGMVLKERALNMGLALAAGGLFSSLLLNPISDWIGKLTAGKNFLYGGGSFVADGLERIAQFLGLSQKDDELKQDDAADIQQEILEDPQVITF